MKDEQKNLEDKIDMLLCYARRQGITEVECIAQAGDGLTVAVRDGQPEKVEHHCDQSIDIIVYDSGRKGVASITDSSEEAMFKALHKAHSMSQYTRQDKYAGLPEASSMAIDWPSLDLYHRWDLGVDHAIDLAGACESYALESDQAISQSDGCSVASYHGARAYGNSHGFIASFLGSRHDLSLGLIAKAEGQMQRDHGYTVARAPEDLRSYQSVAQEAVTNTVAKLAPRPMKTGTVPVIFSAEVAATLIGHFLAAITGRNLYRRSSFLLDKLGAKVFPEWLDIYEDPFIPRGLASSPFDNEGVQVRPRHLVQQGMLSGLLLNSYGARKLGYTSTGNAGGPHNVLVGHQPELTFDYLLQQMGTGLLVTDIIGQGVNLVTGDYSRGASGLWIEDGKIQHPVEEITIAGNLAEMFSRIVAVANDVDARSHIHTGSILIEEMMVAGNYR